MGTTKIDDWLLGRALQSYHLSSFAVQLFVVMAAVKKRPHAGPAMARQVWECQHATLTFLLLSHPRWRDKAEKTLYNKQHEVEPYHMSEASDQVPVCVLEEGAHTLTS